MNLRRGPLEVRPPGASALGPADRLRSSLVRVRGTWARVHRLAAGRSAGDGPTAFVLLHGAGLSAREFTPLARALAVAGPVYLLDLPGHGGLPRPRSSRPEIADLAGVVADVLDDEGVREAVVVGHSMGAQVATELRAGRPDLVAGAVLVGPVVDAGARRFTAQAARFARSSVHESGRTVAVALRGYAASGVPWLTEVLPAMMRYPLERRLTGALTPVALVRGEHDVIAPPGWLEQLQGRLGGAAAGSRTVAGAAHNVVVEDADVVAHAALDVLDRARGAGR
jgi:pimeloyl-ACP methyl ester carboxylesterase